MAITDTSQTVVQDYEYDSFGNLKDQKNRVKQPYAFTGREWDRDARLYDYRTRHYDASVGRFLQKDSIGFLGGINLYAYVNNNPIRWNDPMGLKWIFYGWFVEEKDSFWVKYRWLKARCVHDITHEVKDVGVFYQQYRPFQFNVIPESFSDSSGNEALDSAFDLLDAIKSSGKGTEGKLFRNARDQYDGQATCDDLKEPFVPSPQYCD